MRRINSKGQIWVETVIYTLIGLAIIGMVMAVALPKINAKKDEIVIEQSIEALGNIDDKIYAVIQGGRRIVNLEIRKGALIIDMENETISWVLDSSFAYSEVGMSIPLGRISVMTEKGNPWKITLMMNYSMDLRFDGDNFGKKQLDPAPTPYKFIIERVKDNAEGNIVIDMSES